MLVTRFRTVRLAVTGAAIELSLGIGIYAFPREFNAPVYATLRPFFPYLASGLMAGGVVLLLVVRYALPNWARRTLSLLAAAPLTVLAGRVGAAGAWTGLIFYGILAVALATAPWVTAGPLRQVAKTAPSLTAVTMALTEAAFGALVLLAPGAFATPAYTPIRGLLPAFGATGLVGAAALLLPAGGGRWARPEGLPRRLLGLVLPAIMVYNWMSVGAWTGVLAWGAWVVALLAWRFDFQQDAAEPAAAPGRDWNRVHSLSALERMLETWSWLLALAVVVLEGLTGPSTGIHPARAHGFVLAVSAYNAAMHWGFPRLGNPSSRILRHLSFLTVAIGVLLIENEGSGHTFLVLLAAAPYLAARAAGPAAGRKVLFLALVSVMPGELKELVSGEMLIVPVLAEMALETVLLALVGMLVIQSAADQRRTLEDLEVSRTDLKRQVDQMALIGQIGDAVRRSLVLEEILRTTVEALGQALGVSRCVIRINRGDDVFPVVEEYAAPGVARLGLGPAIPMLMSSWVVQTRQVAAVADVASDPRLDDTAGGRRADLLALGARAVMIAPITAGEELLGLIGFHQCDGPREWTRVEVEFLETAAGQVGVAIAHARAHKALGEHHTALEQAHTNLQSTHEELLAQQEELHAQNEELHEQSEMLRSQRARLEAALVSARKSEEALRMSEAKFGGIISLAADAIVSVDESQTIILYNEAAEQIFGYPAEEALGQSLDILIPRAFAAVHKHHVLAFAHAPEASRPLNESRAICGRRKNGETFPAEASISRLRSGETTIFTVILRDISQRQIMESALAESAERFRCTFDDAPIGMALLGTDGRLLQVNHALCQMSGYSNPELLATTLQAMTDPDDRETSLMHFRQLLAGEIDRYQVEERLLHNLGHPIWALLSVSRVRDAQGNLLHFIAQVQDITDRKRSEEELLYLANRDPLTGLFNRRRFQEEVEHQLAQTRRFGYHGAVMFLDLDGFKYVNDSLGHQVGDDLLKSVAALLRQRLRETDALARLGGDEFAILLPHVGADQAQVVAQSILKALRQHTITSGGQVVGVTASIGIALFPAHGTKANELLAQADAAMYQTKENGRDGFSVCVLAMNGEAALRSKWTWDQRIREALKRDLFVLYAQPILDLRSRQVARYELLLRMVGDDGELISPGAFLEVAERLGLIHAIDRWVVRRSIHLIAEHQRAGRTLCLEVNLSGKAFRDSELLPLIQGEFNLTGIDPSLLVLEITETAAIADIDQARTFLDTLRQLGCRFAIDDFGVGFSSFHHLKHLPVDYLKIDGSFIRELPRDEADQHLVKAMVELASGLEKQTIAEFVGDEETVRLLAKYGVDYAQGYHIGRPAALLTDGTSLILEGHDDA